MTMRDYRANLVAFAKAYGLNPTEIEAMIPEEVEKLAELAETGRLRRSVDRPLSPGKIAELQRSALTPADFETTAQASKIPEISYGAGGIEQAERAGGIGQGVSMWDVTEQGDVPLPPGFIEERAPTWEPEFARPISGITYGKKYQDFESYLKQDPREAGKPPDYPPYDDVKFGAGLTLESKQALARALQSMEERRADYTTTDYTTATEEQRAEMKEEVENEAREAKKAANLEQLYITFRDTALGSGSYDLSNDPNVDAKFFENRIRMHVLGAGTDEDEDDYPKYEQGLLDQEAVDEDVKNIYRKWLYKFSDEQKEATGETRYMISPPSHLILPGLGTLTGDGTDDGADKGVETTKKTTQKVTQGTGLTTDDTGIPTLEGFDPSGTFDLEPWEDIYQLGASTPRAAYDSIALKSMGGYANTPRVQKALSDQYGITRGRWYLQKNLSARHTNYAGMSQEERNPYTWSGWLMDGYKVDPADAATFYDSDAQDFNWGHLVNLGSRPTQPPDAELYDPVTATEEAVYSASDYGVWESIFNDKDNDQYYAAMAKANITGRGLYGKMRKKGLDRLYKRWQQEQIWSENEDRRGFATWLSENVGGPWEAKYAPRKPVADELPSYPSDQDEEYNVPVTPTTTATSAAAPKDVYEALTAQKAFASRKYGIQDKNKIISQWESFPGQYT